MNDTAASSTADHPFEALDWWGLCTFCSLSMATHKAIELRTWAEMNRELRTLPYACPECVTARVFRRPEPHGGSCPRPRSGEDSRGITTNPSAG